jgi:hypothetical protein
VIGTVWSTAGSAVFWDVVCVAHDCPLVLLKQYPAAHIAAQGARVTRIGEIPAATSQLQFIASPARSTTAASTSNPRRPER